jgi:FAD/FMN-containing dehydrogenase/Fe-S oxidoreductase
MDQERERIQADLRGLLEGEVRCDDVFTQLYASDASIYEIRPLGVVLPRSVADVSACVQYAAENAIPIHARGAGTGLAGESLGPGLVMDFSHGMRRVLSVDQEEATVRVQPGVVLAALNRHLANYGRLFGPDPATRSVTTVGGAIGVDTSGSHWLKYGSVRDHVESLQVVLADGTVAEVSRHPVVGGRAGEADQPTQRLVSRLADLIRREEKVIAQHQPATLLNRCGYRLQDVLVDGQLDLSRMLTGSEGTLALVTEATLRTVKMPKYRGLALFFFDRLDSAARAALEVNNTGIATCDLMDRRLLSIAREIDVRYELVIPAEAEALLLIEQSGDDVHEVGERLRQMVVRLVRRKRLAFDARVTLERDERDFYWRLSRRVVTTLYRLRGNVRALPFIEDIAVRPDVLPGFLVRLQNVLKSHEVTASLFGHIGHGQLHIRPFLDLSDPDQVRTMQALAADLYEEVLQVGGTISGEHGTGLSRTWFVRRQCGPLYDVFREVKRIFDPQNILNPGKVVADAPQPLTKNLRPIVIDTREDRESTGAEASGRQAVLPELLLAWEAEDVEYAARACNGCGRCRTSSSLERMCPIFRFGSREEASPRAKANLVRAVLTGPLDPEQLATDDVKAIADLCVHCHQCRLECPAGVDIPKLVVETKAQYVKTNGLSLAQSALVHIDRLSAWGSRFSLLANWMITSRRARWLLEKVIGIAQGRKLPRFHARSFLQRAHRRRLTRPVKRGGRKVLYFVDVYANWHDPQLAEAFVAILEHNGVSVYVHADQLPAGMSAVSLGALDRAKQLAVRNVQLLADAVRQGYHIVATEPSAALCLQHEYTNLLDDEDAALVAENSSEACSYLWRMHQSGNLELDLKPLNMTLGYHMPCHLKALQVGSPGENLLRLIPGLVVQHLERGCSGMAGTFGLQRENYRSSLRAGWGLISSLRSPSLQAGVTECSACKIQMEQGTTKPTVHPLKVLALAYGLMPEIATLMTTRGEELIVT